MRGRADAIVTQELRPWPAAPPPRLMIFLFSSDVHRYMLGIPAEYCSLSQYDTLYTAGPALQPAGAARCLLDAGRGAFRRLVPDICRVCDRGGIDPSRRNCARR